jgi:hypothetical protein
MLLDELASLEKRHALQAEFMEDDRNGYECIASTEARAWEESLLNENRILAGQVNALND